MISVPHGVGTRVAVGTADGFCVKVGTGVGVGVGSMETVGTKVGSGVGLEDGCAVTVGPVGMWQPVCVCKDRSAAAHQITNEDSL